MRELGEVISIIRKISKIDNLFVSKRDMDDDKLQKIGLYNSDYYLYISKNLDYSTVYCIKRIFEIFLNQYKNDIKEDFYERKYITFAKELIDTSKDYQDQDKINLGHFKLVSQMERYVVVKDDEVIFNKGIDEYTLYTSLMKLKNMEEFSMLVKNGETYGCGTKHYKVIVSSDVLFNGGFKVTIKLWLTFFNKLYENELYMHKLQNINTELEETVRLRTLEIERKNSQLEEERDKLNEANLKLLQLNKYLDKLSRIDPLTKLSNRRDFEERFENKIKNIKNEKVSFSLVVGDIDYFKSVNDTYGHECGDMVLKEISNIFRSNLRRDDLVSRYGGEEFVIFIRSSDSAYSFNIIDRIRKAIESRVLEFNGRKFHITMSFGMANFTEEIDFLEGFSYADKALYMAKNDGKNKIVSIWN